MSKQILRLWSHLLPHRKNQLGILLIVTIIASIAEVVSIGAILPFLGALIEPGKLFENPLAQSFISTFKLKDPRDLLLPLTIFFTTTVILASAARLTLLWLQTRIGHSIGSDLSIEMYERTLYQPYQVHLSRNSSEIVAGISTKINTVVAAVILPLLTMMSSLFMLILILVALIVIDPWVALAAFGGIGSIYFVITLSTRKQLSVNSKKISQNKTSVIKALNEGMGGIRDILIDGTQKTYCAIYRASDVSLRGAEANNQIIGGAPRFLIEPLGISLIALLAYGISMGDEGFAGAIPILGALALGAQRLLPVMQQLYASWSSFRGGQASLNDVVTMISQPLSKHSTESPKDLIPFEKRITLDRVGFCYLNQSSMVLREINLEINKGSRIGITGRTGSGKSTLLDIVMGLLIPTSGVLRVDSSVITENNYRAWQGHVSHVPQNIFLADVSIAENIAFGVPRENIDIERVKAAAHKAQISQLIESLENQYNTLVGERGVRLSGGQRQRIGIARALYKKSSLIIFDEATSALDNETESAVMRAINAIDSDVTIIIVAHRLTTLSSCDEIYDLSNGKIKKVNF